MLGLVMVEKPNHEDTKARRHEENLKVGLRESRAYHEIHEKHERESKPYRRVDVVTTPLRLNGPGNDVELRLRTMVAGEVRSRSLRSP
jgi:hypothetical protein